MGEHFLIGIVCVILFGVGSQWIAWKTKLPAILLLLVAGIIAGPITGLLDPDALMGNLLAPFVSISVGIILFEGGLSLRFSELRNIGGAIIKLVSVGVVLTWIISTLSAFYLFDMNIQLAVLLGAILVVTGPTVIIPLLRQVRPTGQVSSVLRWEGIVIDPIGAMLTVLVFEVIIAGGLSEGISLALSSIFKTVFFGSLVGLAGAGIIYILLKRYLLPDFLQNPVTLMIVLVVFAVSNTLQHESGLWATTVMGIALANQKSARIHHIVEFKENLRLLLLSALFVLLAARVELANLIGSLNWQILAFLLILIFVARPLSVYLSTIGSQLNNREKLFLSWMAPRGVVAASISSLFAYELVQNGYAEAGQLVPIVFIIIISTVAIYGLSASKVARYLGVAKPTPRGFLMIGAHQWARDIAELLHDKGFKVLLADSNWSNINKARKMGLKTYYGNVLSEYAIDEINLDGIGKLLALTPNDEVNSLAVIRYKEIFGTSEVFQLAAATKAKRADQEVPDNLSGRILFDENLNFDNISTALKKGAELELVEIEQTLTQEEFDHKIKHLTPLFLIKATQEIRPYTVDFAPLPGEGDTLICLGKIEDSYITGSKQVQGQSVQN
ncbi:cation:proton antiporter [Fodinibius salsisoli]|uniref:Cation:proton antiporter n=1 Tax=Fodinibius salsisoli TaxID=2820877 RepID=A0ABT3PRR3_9BACT|nr:sodium:proton antiporter [Fodinibius salsisoli]MCW9708542.1 cation:proton antiporter [Fodinibius salsisoli]